MKRQISKSPKLQVDITVSLEDQIAKRAHELFVERGSQHGNDLNDWLQAEREIKEWHQSKSTGSPNK